MAAKIANVCCGRLLLIIIIIIIMHFYHATTLQLRAFAVELPDL